MTRQQRRELGRKLASIMEGWVQVDGRSLDHGWTAVHFFLCDRPHGCFRNAINMLEVALPGAAYVEGRLAMWSGGELVGESPHGWLEFERRIIDRTIVDLVEPAAKAVMPVVLRYQPLVYYGHQDVLRHIRAADAAGVALTLPIAQQLRAEIGDQEHEDPAMFSRIKRRQVEHDGMRASDVEPT